MNTEYSIQKWQSHFYQKRIKNGINISDKEAIQIIDSSTYNPFCGRDQRGQSRFNEVHAQIVVDLAQQLSMTYPSENIGIITPYRAQASHIRKSLQLKKKSDIEVGTIHTFQGREKEVIIFDVTDSNPLPAGRLLDERGPNGEDALKILTVAFSRAKERLIIIANVEYLKRRFEGRKLLDIINEN